MADPSQPLSVQSDNSGGARHSNSTTFDHVAVAPITPSISAPGWYGDPWQVAVWRWWDGIRWTPHTSFGAQVGWSQAVAQPTKTPRWRAWLSWPIAVSLILVVPSLVLIGISSPRSIIFGLVPLFIVLPCLAWLDRVEPEPRASRGHALLWGGSIAVLVASIVNVTVMKLGSERLGLVVSAPIIEEGMKGLGVFWAVRRKEIDSPIDGIIFAGWVALGFAVFEDFTYFARARSSKEFFTLVIGRALLTPFAHPLFTAWTGLALGRAVAQGKSKWNGLWGYVVAVFLHASWNGSISLASTRGGGVLYIVLPCFIVIFVVSVVMIAKARQKERDRFVASVASVAARVGLAPAEIAAFSTWKSIRESRKGVSRNKRSAFDALHGSLARIVALEARTTSPENPELLRQVNNVHSARTILQRA
jgi:protease PrsW